MDTNTNFSLPDFALGVALLSLIATGLVYYTKKTRQSFDGYFLAGKSMGWLTFGISLLITAISSELLFGLVLFDCLTGFSIRVMLIVSLFGVFAIGWFFIRRYLKMNIITISEYIESKFGPKVKNYFTWVNLATFVFLKTALVLFVYGILLQELFKVDMVSYLLLLVLMTGVFTLVGGLNTIMNLQVFQAIMLFITLIYLSISGWGLIEINNLLLSLISNIKNYIGNQDSYSPYVIFPTFIILSIWVWGGDQCIIQKATSTKDSNVFIKGTFFAFLLLLILVAISLSSSGSVDNALNNTITPTVRYLNFGEKALLFVSISIFLMSSLANVFQNSALVYTNDIYKNKYKDASEQKLVLVGRLSTTIIITVAILLVTLIKLISFNFFIDLFGTYTMILSSFVALIIITLIAGKINSAFTFFVLLSGNILSLLKIILTYTSDKGNDQFFLSWSYFDFSVILFVISFISLALYSLATYKNNEPETIKLN